MRRARTPVATSIFSSDDARLYIDFFLLGMPVATSIVILRGCPSLRRFCPGRPSLQRFFSSDDARRYIDCQYGRTAFAHFNPDKNHFVCIRVIAILSAISK